MIRILFILKYRESSYDGGYSGYSDPSYSCEDPAWGPGTPEYGQRVKLDWAYTKGLSSGLLNSAKFVADMLAGIPDFEVKLVQVLDNNYIDREVAAFKPDICIIEAYWVVPEKFEILTKLHPKVKWVIRNHSNIPFLANEGIAFGWTLDYVKHPNVFVASNDMRAHRELGVIINEFHETSGIRYLPNYYPLDVLNKPLPAPHSKPHEIDIACFGAIRPLKNHMIQAIAAIEYAQKHKKYLRFHINGNRIEGNGQPILKNLREMFKRLDNAELVEHPWCDHPEFMKLVSSMDLGLQVSFTETFNIVAADFVVNRVPIVTSNEIEWSEPLLQADPTDSSSIVKAMERAIFIHKHLPWSTPHVKGLKLYDHKSKHQWTKVIHELAAK